MESKEPYPILVPWSTRDVWVGVASVVLMTLGMAGISQILKLTDLQISADIRIDIEFCITELIFIAPVWWLTIHKYKVPLKTLGFRKYLSGNLGLGCGLTFLSYCVFFIYAVILARFNLRMQASLSPVFAELSSPWFFLVGGAIIAPFAEELFFRGFVFAGLRSKYGWKISAVISSLLFSAAHLEITFLLPAFILGFLFAYLYKRSRSIWPGIILHLCINTFGLTMAFIAWKFSL